MEIDRSRFINEPYYKRVAKPWGYEIHFVPENRPYMGKVIHVEAGKRWSLQIHDQKLESWFLISGRAKMLWDNTEGKLVETELEIGKGYGCEIGQRHRLVAITDCDIFEVSTPEIGNTIRLEDDYQRPTETEELRKDPNRGWNL